MIIISLALAAAPAVDAQPVSHRARLDHRGTPIDLVYEGAARLRVKEIGSSPPTRPSMVRCLWSVDVDVNRHIRPDGAAAGTLHRTFTTEKLLKGERPGRCITNRKAIDRDVTARRGDVDAHVAALAQRDRPAVLAELDAARTLASN